MTENTNTRGGRAGAFFRKVGGFFRKVGGFFKRHKVLSVVLAILIIVGIVIVNVLSSMRNAAANMAQAPQTLTLEKMDLEQIVSGEGTVQSATARQVGTSLTSKITNVYVEEGDYVNAGDVLCQLDTTDIDKSIADAKKEIAKQQANDSINLAAAQRKLDNAIEQYSIDEAAQNRKVQEAANAINNARAAAGNAALEAAAVAAGNAAVLSSPEKAALDTAQAALDAQQIVFAGQDALYQIALNHESILVTAAAGEEDNVAQSLGYPDAGAAQAYIASAKDAYNVELQNLQAAQQALAAAQNAYQPVYQTAYNDFKANNQHIYNDAYNSADVSALQSAYDTAVETRDSVLRNDNNSIAAAREALATQKLMDSASSQKTQLENLEKEKEESTITAPVSGTIVEITAEVGLSPSSAAAANATSGTSSGATTSLFTIKDEGALEVLVSVPEYDAVTLSLNLPVSITSDAITGQEWNGIVTNISPAATDDNSNFSVTIQITSAVDKLAIGMSAKVNVITNAKNDVFAVPYDAVTTDASGQSVVYAYEAQNQQGGGGMPDRAQGQPADDGVAPVSAGSGGMAAAPQGRAIVVETGMETDYYIEISGEGLSEGMLLLADPEGKNVSTSNDFGFMMGGGGF